MPKSPDDWKQNWSRSRLTYPWRITELGQNQDAPRYCATLLRIGQPLMLAGPFGAERFEKELLVECLLDVELH